MARIPPSFIQDLIARSDIVEIIESRLALRKTGANFSARCPFHDEKSPSFTVSPSKQFYYCFGCSAHGNVIGFLMAFERLDFLAAVELLAAKAGLEIPYEEGAQTKPPEFQELYQIMTDIARYYQCELRKSKLAIDYLKSRGITGEMAKRFGIGFAPAGWDNLTQQIKSSPSLLITAGMVIEKENKRCYDRFRNRIIFPIRDIRGRVIAFGGRVLSSQDSPKYLNSPETPIFHKSHELYGFYEMRQLNRQLSRIVIVEGYLDVIALSQYDVTYSVATLGTATSSKHLQRLLQQTSEIIFCFDGDKAGKKAAWRALETALPLMHDGVKITFIFLPENEDPDSFIRQKGKIAFEDRLKNALSLPDFFFQQLSLSIDLKQLDGKAKLAKLANDLLQHIPRGIFQQLMYERLAKEIGVDLKKLDVLIHEKTIISSKPVLSSSKNKPDRSPIRHAITLLLQHPELAKEIPSATLTISMHSPDIEILQQLLQLLKNNSTLSTGALLEHWRDHPAQDQLAKLALYELMIPQDALKTELFETLERIIVLDKEQTVQNIMQLAKERELCPQEKQQLQQLISENLTNPILDFKMRDS
jgi:DNA primase